MSKALRMLPEQWTKLSERLKEEYPLSVCLISWKMKEVLGFTKREHQEWIPCGYDDQTGKPLETYRTMVHLDFYEEKKKTWFLLKYGDYLLR